MKKSDYENLNSRAKIATFYGTTVKTINKWIEPIEKELNHEPRTKFNNEQIDAILEKIGKPFYIIKKVDKKTGKISYKFKDAI